MMNLAEPFQRDCVSVAVRGFKQRELVFRTGA
jgi:hypothetical protein